MGDPLPSPATSGRLDAIDGRSALGRALREYRADLVRDLGGEENLSTAELHLVDLAVRDRLFLDSLDAALAERPLLKSKKGQRCARSRGSVSDG
jgi:hypothetical protein